MKQRGEFEVEGQSLSYLPALICGVGRKGFKQTNCWSSYAQLRHTMRGTVERRGTIRIHGWDGMGLCDGEGGGGNMTRTYY